MFWCLLEGEWKSSYVGSERPQIQCCSWDFLAWKLEVHWSKVKVVQLCLTLCDRKDYYGPWNSPGQNTGVVSLSILQGILPNQGLNPGLRHCRQILYQLRHKGSPGILEWVAYPFSSKSFQPRNRTWLSCMAGGSFINWAIREAPKVHSVHFSSVAQSCPILCDPMDCSTPGLPVHHQIPELAQTHVHWVGDAIQPSHPLSAASPPAFNLSQHQGLFKWVSSSYQMAKGLEFQLQHQS